MKQGLLRRFALLLALLVLGGYASARRLQIGVRGGINTADFRFSPVTLGDDQFVAGPSRMGIEAGLVVRFNLSQYVHLQSELNGTCVNYALRHCSEGRYRSDIRMRSERLELPVQLGFQFGPVRLFGGPSFRLHSVLKSGRPGLVKVGFDNNRTAWMGGLGVNIKHFFIDVRIQGYPSARHTASFIGDGQVKRVRTTSDLVYGGSLGFFF